MSEVSTMLIIAGTEKAKIARVLFARIESTFIEFINTSK